MPVIPLLLACVRADPNLTDDESSDSGETPVAPAVPFDVIGFNVESGGSDPAIVADETVALIEGEELWGFAEIEDDVAAGLVVAAANDPGTDQDFQYVLGTTGWEDRLVLAWDDTRFELLSSYELLDIELDSYRAPLVGEMRERSSGAEFLFVVNHLARGEEDIRHEQAELLHDWGATHSGPVVMVGDYNFDWDVTTGEHDQGYDSLTAGGVFVWLRPEALIKTQCSPFYDSVLDFVFVGGEARDWSATTEILRPGDEYCAQRNIETFSDHRPILASFELPAD